MNMRRLALPPSVTAWQAPLRARWQAMALRERRLVAAGGSVLALFVLWLVLVQPALSTVRAAPARLDRLDTQLQEMQRLAAEGRELRNATPLSSAQSAIALKAATDRLGERARLSVQGDRAVLTLTGVSGEQLRSWLADARNGARARPVEAQLNRVGTGYNGTLVLQLGGAGS
ncbi:type II secretion system protein GspM [Ideonella sp. BN130291]|uniref:type II secretion system protein GspM n=1 Tax=Ideonella sp. BN130291 TaxID=3112940 RepID=UPI002E2703BC|nr:type II secretion system protein GspM [Ideonella sp. BN130291]